MILLFFAIVGLLYYSFLVDDANLIPETTVVPWEDFLPPSNYCFEASVENQMQNEFFEDDVEPYEISLVTTVVIFPLPSNDCLIVSGSKKNTALQTGKFESVKNPIQNWNFETGEEVHTLRGHYVFLFKDDADPYENSLVTTVVVFPVPSNDCFIVPDSIKNTVLQTWKVESEKNQTENWDFETGEEVHTLRSHYVFFFKDAVVGQFLYNSLSETIPWTPDTEDEIEIKFWKFETDDTIQTFRGHSQFGEPSQIWNYETGKVLYNFRGHSQYNFLFGQFFYNSLSATTSDTFYMDPTTMYTISDSTRNLSLTWASDTEDETEKQFWKFETCDKIQSFRGHFGEPSQIWNYETGTVCYNFREYSQYPFLFGQFFYNSLSETTSDFFYMDSTITYTISSSTRNLSLTLLSICVTLLSICVYYLYIIRSTNVLTSVPSSSLYTPCPSCGHPGFLCTKTSVQPSNLYEPLENTISTSYIPPTYRPETPTTSLVTSEIRVYIHLVGKPISSVYSNVNSTILEIRSQVSVLYDIPLPYLKCQYNDSQTARELGADTGPLTLIFHGPVGCIGGMDVERQ